LSRESADTGDRMNRNCGRSCANIFVRSGEKQTMSDSNHRAQKGRQGPEEDVCFFCGTVPEGSVLVHGLSGSICSSCVFSLSARLAEAEREQVDPTDAAPPPDTTPESVIQELDGELSAHAYENRVDLAEAYLELGKRGLAITEYFGALEAALACHDWPFALQTIARLRKVADGPTTRDRIHEMLSRHVPESQQ